MILLFDWSLPYEGALVEWRKIIPTFTNFNKSKFFNNLQDEMNKA